MAQAQQTRSPFGAWSFSVVASAVMTFHSHAEVKTDPSDVTFGRKELIFKSILSMILLFKISLISFQSSCAVQESSGNNYCCRFDVS